MLDIWKENTGVRFGHIDRSDRLTLGSIFSFFQEAAISHAEALGVGREGMARNGQAWVLSRMSIFAKRRPLYWENIEVSSWPRGCEKLFAIRDYLIRDTQGSDLVRGRSCWLVLDMEKRRPLRVQPIVDLIPHNEGIDAFSSIQPGLDSRENLTNISERRALYSDIDYFGHVNNARYIQWIQDAADMDILTKTDQMRFDINYLSEVLPGETVELWACAIEESGHDGAVDYPSQGGPSFAFEGRRPGSDKVTFRAELRTSRSSESCTA